MISLYVHLDFLFLKYFLRLNFLTGFGRNFTCVSMILSAVFFSTKIGHHIFLFHRWQHLDQVDYESTKTFKSASEFSALT